MQIRHLPPLLRFIPQFAQICIVFALSKFEANPFFRPVCNENSKESNRFRLSNTTTLHLHNAFCTFVWGNCTTTTWKCLISRFVEDLNTRQRLSLSFPEVRCSLLEFNSRKIWQHLTNSTRWNKGDKFAAARIHFISDVFVAVAVLVA